jgi:hypothetical protein
MANETRLADMNDIYFAAWVEDMVLQEARPYNVSYPLWRRVGRQASNAVDFPIQADPGVSTTGTTEGTGLSNTRLTTDKATATASTYGQMATVTDELAAASLIDVMAQVSKVLARSLAEIHETLSCDFYDDFSNASGTTTSDLTIPQFVAAIGALNGRDAEGELVAVLHPQQVLDLLAGSGNSPAGLFTFSASSSFYGNPQLNQSIADDLSRPAGYVGQFLGVDIFQTSAVVTANAAADRAGAIFVKGVALGEYEVWGPRVELQRDANIPGTELVGTRRFGQVEIRDAWGQSIITDA